MLVSSAICWVNTGTAMAASGAPLAPALGLTFLNNNFYAVGLGSIHRHQCLYSILVLHDSILEHQSLVRTACMSDVKTLDVWCVLMSLLDEKTVLDKQHTPLICCL